MKEQMIKEYITTIIGDYGIEVEIIEDTIVLSREERWHIYLCPFTMIGCFVDEDIEIAEKLRLHSYEIQYIKDHSNETV